jgi:hypothetical protein
MSFLIHRCACGHPDIFHGGKREGSCEMKGCRCIGGRDMSAPEVLPTRNNGRPVETLVEPGTRPPGYTGLQLCPCAACVSLYRELTGAV